MVSSKHKWDETYFAFRDSLVVWRFGFFLTRDIGSIKFEISIILSNSGLITTEWLSTSAQRILYPNSFSIQI